MAEHEVRSRAVYDHDNEEPRPAGRRRRQVADWGVGEEIFDHMPGRRFERRQHQEIPRGEAVDGRRTIVIETGDEDLPSSRRGPVSSQDDFASREEALRARETHDELWGGDEPFAPGGAETRDRDEPYAPGGAETRDRDEPFAPGGAQTRNEPWGGDEPFAPGGAERRDESRAGDEPRGAGTPQDEAEFVAASGGQHDTGEFASVYRGDAGEPGAEAPTGRTEATVRGGQAGRRTVKIGGRPAEFHGPPARARQRPPRAMHERLGPRPDRVAMWAFALGLLLILIAIATANA